MKKSRVVFVILVLAITSSTLLAQAWRGNGRLQGTVTDEEGNPINGAKVMLRAARGGNTGPDVTTNNKGKWAMLGLIGGQWDIDVQAEGFETRKMSVGLSEVDRMPPVPIKLKKLPPPEPARTVEAPREEVRVAGQAVAPEIAIALENGNKFIADSNFKDAVVEYEKAYVALPNNVALKMALARAYYGAKQSDKAIVILKDVYAADSTNTNALVLLTNLLLEGEKFDEAKVLLEKIPAGSITDPSVMTNFGKHFYNRNRIKDAWKYFDAAVTLDPTVAESYYYRALAEIQLDKKTEAKKDLKKVIELAPDSQDAKDAAEMLAALK